MHTAAAYVYCCECFVEYGERKEFQRGAKKGAVYSEREELCERVRNIMSDVWCERKRAWYTVWTEW